MWVLRQRGIKFLDIGQDSRRERNQASYHSRKSSSPNQTEGKANNGNHSDYTQIANVRPSSPDPSRIRSRVDRVQKAEIAVIMKVLLFLSVFVSWSWIFV
jgi:hypothetical protein